MPENYFSMPGNWEITLDGWTDVVYVTDVGADAGGDGSEVDAVTEAASGTAYINGLTLCAYNDPQRFVAQHYLLLFVSN